MTDQPTDYSSIDAFHVGRRRKPNFTDHEVLYIIEQYDMYKELLHSREASKSVIAQKQAIWKQITENLNTSYPQVERTVEDVRRKWKKLQSEAKREVAAYRTAQLAGSTTPVTNKQMNLYNRILSICRAPIPSSSSHFAHAVAVAAAMHRQQALQLQSNMNNGNSSNHETTFNEQVRKKNNILSCIVIEKLLVIFFLFYQSKKNGCSFPLNHRNKIFQ
jgi:maltooligosyltrehalose synthase